MSFNISSLVVSPEDVLSAAGILPREDGTTAVQELEGKFGGNVEDQQGYYMGVVKSLVRPAPLI